MQEESLGVVKAEMLRDRVLLLHKRFFEATPLTSETALYQNDFVIFSPFSGKSGFLGYFISVEDGFPLHNEIIQKMNSIHSEKNELINLRWYQFKTVQSVSIEETDTPGVKWGEPHGLTKETEIFAKGIGL